MGGQNNNPTALELLYREGKYLCGEILKDKTYDLLSQKLELEKFLVMDPPPDLEWNAAMKEYLNSFSENEKEGLHWVASLMARKLRNNNWFLGSKKDENDPNQAPSKYTDLVNRG